MAEDKAEPSKTTRGRKATPKKAEPSKTTKPTDGKIKVEFIKDHVAGIKKGEVKSFFSPQAKKLIDAGLAKKV